MRGHLVLFLVLVPLAQAEGKPRKTAHEGRTPSHDAPPSVPLRTLRTVLLDDSVGDLRVPHAVAHALSELAVEHGLRVSEEPWGALRPRCLCRKLAVWDPTGTRKKFLIVEPPLGGNNLIGKDATLLRDIITEMARPRVIHE